VEFVLEVDSLSVDLFKVGHLFFAEDTEDVNELILLVLVEVWHKAISLVNVFAKSLL